MRVTVHLFASESSRRAERHCSCYGEPGFEAVDALMVADRGQSPSGLRLAPPRGSVRLPASRAHPARRAQGRRGRRSARPHCAGRLHGSVLAQAARGFRAAGWASPGRLPSHSQPSRGCVRQGRTTRRSWRTSTLRHALHCVVFALESSRRAERCSSTHGEPGSEAVVAPMLAGRGQGLSGLRCQPGSSGPPRARPSQTPHCASSLRLLLSRLRTSTSCSRPPYCRPGQPRTASLAFATLARLCVWQGRAIQRSWRPSTLRDARHSSRRCRCSITASEPSRLGTCGCSCACPWTRRVTTGATPTA